MPGIDRAAPERTLVVQFDAHLDIYDLADCTRELSHGNFLRHVDGTLPEIVNIGHREQVLTADAIAPYFSRVMSAAEWRRRVGHFLGHRMIALQQRVVSQASEPRPGEHHLDGERGGEQHGQLRAEALQDRFAGEPPRLRRHR